MFIQYTGREDFALALGTTAAELRSDNKNETKKK
jgi:hypothetical protein